MCKKDKSMSALHKLTQGQKESSRDRKSYGNMSGGFLEGIQFVVKMYIILPAVLIFESRFQLMILIGSIAFLVFALYHFSAGGIIALMALIIGGSLAIGFVLLSRKQMIDKIAFAFLCMLALFLPMYVNFNAG